MSLHEVITWAEEYFLDEKLKGVFKDIRQEAKRLNIEVPVVLLVSSRSLAERERENKLAAKIKENSKRNSGIPYFDW